MPATFQGLGFLNSTDQLSKGFAVARDGSEAFGTSLSAPSTLEALSWTSGAGAAALGDLSTPVVESSAHGSAPGDVVVGVGTSPSCGYDAFLIDGTTAIVGLGRLPGDAHSAARDVTVVGSGASRRVVVVGRSWTKRGDRDAVVWEQTTSGVSITRLGHRPGFKDQSLAYGVSDDGLWAVGKSDTDQPRNSTEAVRWRRANLTAAWGQPRSLHPGGSTAVFGKALAISGDSTGYVIAGQMYDRVSDQFVAFLWDGTQTSPVMTPLTPSSTDHVRSRARDVVRTTGSIVIVGEYKLSTSSHDEAFIWDSSETTSQMRSLRDVLAAAGAPMGNWELRTAHSISSDGQVIVGTGVETPTSPLQGWIADLSAREADKRC